jgi:hypothetical protein
VSARLSLVSAVGLLLAAPALTLAAFDWMMSLSPAWSSSIYGVYYFAGAMVGAHALIVVVMCIRRLRRRPLPATAEHLHALAKLMFAFVLFWGYTWYSQFFITWIAGIPSETAWYVVRFVGPWDALVTLVVVGGFAIPSIVLLVRAARRSFAMMGTLGVWLLFVQYLNVYWLVVPERRPVWTGLSLLWDLGALALVAGSATAVALWREASRPHVAVIHPRLSNSLRYESS